MLADTPLIQCPSCNGTLVQMESGFECRACGNTVNADELSWPAVIRTYARNAGDRRQALFNSVVAGRGAWHMLLDLQPDAVVLDLHCGTGSISQIVAPLVAKVVATDYRPAELGIARARFRRFNADDDITIAVIDEDGRLPFADDSFDCVLFSGEDVPRTLRQKMLRDARRVLKADGQLFMTGDNRLLLTGRDRLNRRRFFSENGITYRGYRRLLKKSGFDSVSYFSLLRSVDYLYRIVPLDAPDKSWQPAQPTGLKERIKADKRAAGSYGLLAESNSSAKSSFVDRLLAHIAAELESPTVDSPPMLQEYRISRKEKLILRVRFGQRDTFVRVPQIAAALASEQRNAKTLQSLSPAQRNPVKAPRSLLAGRYQGAQYFVESTVPGSAIGPSVRTAGLLPFIEQIQDLLDQLNPAPAATTPRVLDEARYETEVSKPLRKIAQVVPDEKKLASLAAYFGERLAGVLLPVGLTHGDFSASNIFHEKHRLISLIDWESSRADGLPVIDAIALVDSLERLQSGERVGKTIPRLAAGQFHSDVAKQFLMARYERWSIDPALHEALVYLKWLHHIAYLTDFWLVYDERALDLFVTPVVESIVARR